jgi:hypothetical protein
MNEFQSWGMIIFMFAAQICTKRLLKKSAKGKVLPSEYSWFILPPGIIAAFFVMFFVCNNWFVGSVVPDEFIENRNRYFYLGIYAALIGAYRIVAGVYRYRKTKYDDTVFGDEDRHEAKVIIVSGLILLLTALMIYIAVEVVAPFVWWLKMK